MRPPGHHATRDRALGFCYFSNVAVAALDASENGAERIAIWDFDGHHGNGTEAIVAHNERIRFASIHQFPAYPGTGAKSFANIVNYPIRPFTARSRILDIARRSRSEEHTSELQSQSNLVCRLLLEKKKITRHALVKRGVSCLTVSILWTCSPTRDYS